MATDAYEEVLAKSRGLNPDEQKRLLKDLQSLVSPNGDRRRSILELQGLGKNIWAGVDAQEYVDQERASWRG